MRLTAQQEFIVIGILIAYIAFVPAPTVVKDALRSALGKAAALVAVVYVWKYVNPIAALLLLIVYARDAGFSISEHLDVAPLTCKCKNPGFTPNATKSGCINKDGKEDKAADALTCTCPDGYAWDIIQKSCQASQANESKPIAAAAVGSSPAIPAASDTASTSAPANASGPVTSPNMPQTTGSAAGQMTASATPQSSASTGGAQPTTSGVSSTQAPV